MKSNKKGFTLIELLAVIVILAVIALITTPIVLNLINDAKESANLRSVEAYAKALEYGVIQYEYNNNGELPSSYDEIKDYVNYTNTEVKCDIAINCDKKGGVKVENCKVGTYTNNYYEYNGNVGSSINGAKIDEDSKGPTNATPACN